MGRRDPRRGLYPISDNFIELGHPYRHRPTSCSSTVSCRRDDVRKVTPLVGITRSPRLKDRPHPQSHPSQAAGQASARKLHRTPVSSGIADKWVLASFARKIVFFFAPREVFGRGEG